MTDTIRIKQSQLEQSNTPYSVVITDNNNEQTFLAPGTLGQVLSVGTGGTLQFTNLPSSNNWSLVGNAGTNPVNNFIGTTDSQPLIFRTANTERGRFLETNGFLGLNVASPTRKLHIHEPLAATAVAMKLTNATTGALLTNGFEVGLTTGLQAEIRQRENSDILIFTNNIERMRVLGSSSGVTVGTPTPTAKVVASELSIQTTGFCRTSSTHTSLTATGRSEFFAGTNTASGFNAMGYSNAGFASPFTGVSTAYAYLTFSGATDFHVGANGVSLPQWTYKSGGNVGFGETNPQVKLDVNGGLALSSRTVTASGAILGTDYTCLINNGAAAITVTLNSAVTFRDRIVVIRRKDATSTGVVTIDSAAGTVQSLNGTLSASTTLAACGTRGDCLTFQSDGNNWYIIAA